MTNKELMAALAALDPDAEVLMEVDLNLYAEFDGAVVKTVYKDFDYLMSWREDTQGIGTKAVILC